MQIVAKAILAVLWLVIVPGAAGIPYLKNKKNFAVGEALLAGYLFFFSAGEIFLLLSIVLDVSLNLAAGILGGFMILSAVYGISLLRGIGKNRWRRALEQMRLLSPWFWAAVLMIAVQIFVVVYYAHMDADDAFYLGTATSAVETNTLFSIDPYTGAAYETLPKRYILSPFPVLLAVISRLCMGLHPAILAHVIYPAVFLPAVYLCFYYMGKKWFPQNRNSQGMFLMFAAILTWFSGFSVYTSGNFTMVRIWQGKALLAGFLLPLTFYLCWCLFLEEEKSGSFVLLAMANLACCHVSSMGIMLSPIMIGMLALMGAVKKKSLKVLFQGILCCCPSLILGTVYIFL